MESLNGQMETHSEVSLTELGSYRRGYYSILLASHFMWGGALDSSDVHVS